LRSIIELFILEIKVAILTYLARIFPRVTICVPKTRIGNTTKERKHLIAGDHLIEKFPKVLFAL